MAKVDWAWRLRRAARAGKFTEADKRLAGVWQTCAVGESVPKSLTNNRRRVALLLTPTMLVRWGTEFYHAVQVDDVDQAAVLHTKIVEGAKELRTQLWADRRARRALT